VAEHETTIWWKIWQPTLRQNGWGNEFICAKLI